jgi:pilus assembly protein CpaC
MEAARSRAAKVAALVLYIIVILVATPQAQQPVAFSGSPGSMSRGPAATPPDATTVDLLVGRSTILNVGSAIARVSLTVPDVADAMVTAPQELLIHGKAPGTISLFVWDRAGGIKTYEVNVRRDLKQLVDQMVQLFPGEGITVIGSGKDVVLSGTVTSKYVIDKAADVASGYVDKKENVINLLKQQEGIASNQVMLRVRFAEVSRSAMQELGASLIMNQFKSDWYGRTTTQQFPAPDFDSSKPGQLNFSDFLNLFVFNSKEGLGAVVKALSSKGLFQSLAEPNLIALNGKEASFLAGGEYPYPVVQPGGGVGNSVTIMFKEFGVRLHFTPTILGNGLIHLKVAPEVSSLDFSNAIQISGFRVPALSTRKTETEVELQDGQTFAVAGLMNNTVNSTMQKIPGIGDIPVLGYLFKSRAYQKNQTELVVMITPVIIRAGSTGVSSGLPAAVEPYLAPPTKTIAQPAPYVGSPAFPPSQSPQPSRPGGDQAPAPVQQPASASMPPAVSAAPAVVPAPVPQAAAPEAPAPDVTAPPAPKVDTKAEAREREAQRKAAEAQKAADRRAAEAQKALDAKAAEEKAVADKHAAEAKAAADAKAAEEKAIADKKAAEAKAVADKKAAEDKARLDKLKAERDRHEAEVAKKNAEIARRKAEEQKKHEKPLQEAAARLKAAQAAYEAELQKKKGAQ